MRRTTDVTNLLEAWSGGDASALERLLPIVLGDLRKLAARRMRQERSGHTLSPTALIHEAYLRLVGHQPSALRSRTHFFGLASELMRRVLVDHARRRGAAKRPSGALRVSLDEALEVAESPDADLVAVDEALTALAALDPRQARIVELRFFGGLSVEEAAAVLNVSRSTAERDWRLARAWLYRQLAPGREGGRS